MAKKPVPPPKPNLFSPRKSSSSNLDDLTKKAHSIEISSPFATFNEQEPQFFFPISRPLHHVKTHQSVAAKGVIEPLKEISSERRTSLPEPTKKHHSKPVVTAKEEKAPLRNISSSTETCQRVESGTVAEAKRRLLGCASANTNATTALITSNDAAQCAHDQPRSGMPVRIRSRTACSNQRLSDVLSACSSTIQVELDKEGDTAGDDKESDLNASPAEAELSSRLSKRATGFVGKMVAELETGAREEFASSASHSASVSSDAKGEMSRNSLSLKLILREFPAAVQGSIPADEISMLLKDLPQLEEFSEELLKDLQEHLDNYEQSRCIASVFTKKGSFLLVYVTYIRDYQKMIDTFHALKRRYPSFAEKVSKFEQSPSCKMLPLDTFFLKPVQRLPRYPLLLGTYLSALDEAHPDRENAKRALDLVSDITGKANISLAEIEKASRLLWYQARSAGYIFLKPNRNFIKDGTLKKLSRKYIEERTVLLCSDAVICGEFDSFSKFTVNAEYPINEIKVDILDENYFDRDLEFGIYSKVVSTKSSAFQAASIEERNAWMNALRRAIEERQKLGIRSSHSSQELKMAYAPIWIPDYRVRACQLCKKPFGLFRRYHHCRSCGYAVCSGCSPHELEIDYKDRRPKRVCSKCFQTASTKDDERVLLTDEPS
ncbi:FYVE, RhoGEF and PH domain-containing protein 6-like isoform X2 [Paramacrobiotus metropolitanus]|uniref:FYVE, RhoGEF and PH domain-containing protein 6-like isoform X2 n=1 Tax=Paramacrobiotus metropolitanus TaxID=2943436 RepID=UPI0024456A8A|nr:FYVE, RhoGEF and PH domain-containing protein 6-like isoform X2 [Paramacrobiotus metropolitanus]